MTAIVRRLRVASYNIHGAHGPDRRRKLDEVIAVLAEIDADIVGLQEVDTVHLGPEGDQFHLLETATGMHAAAGPAIHLGWRRYGNVLLSRWPILRRGLFDLSIGRREPRGAIHAEIGVNQTDAPDLRVIVTHLGLRIGERRQQMRVLRSLMALEPPVPVAVMGDFNAWGPERLALYRMGAGMAWGAPATFPARLPLITLDRIWTRPRRVTRRVFAHRTPLAREASDHLPVVAELDPGRA